MKIGVHEIQDIAALGHACSADDDGRRLDFSGRLPPEDLRTYRIMLLVYAGDGALTVMRDQLIEHTHQVVAGIIGFLEQQRQDIEETLLTGHFIEKEITIGLRVVIGEA